MPTLGTTKLFQTIGELYIVYLQSKKFLSEETLLTNHHIMNRVKRDHDKLENIFEDLTRLQEYHPADLLRLGNSYYSALCLDITLKNTKNVTSENCQENERYKKTFSIFNDTPMLEHVNYKTEKIINNKINYKKFLNECMKNNINHIKDSDTENNSTHDIIYYDWIALSSALEDEFRDSLLALSFKDALSSLGLDVSSDITRELGSKLCNQDLKKTCIHIGKGLFHKNKPTDMLSGYVSDLQSLQNDIELDYNTEPSFDEYSHEHFPQNT